MERRVIVNEMGVGMVWIRVVGQPGCMAEVVGCKTGLLGEKAAQVVVVVGC